MITASTYKSIGYSAGNHKVVHNVCISLFCKHKGYIPYGEKEFPRRIGNFDVDVLEGYCSFGSLEIGGHVRRNGGSSGSIGGLVDLPGNKIGFITCAHVLFSPEDLIFKNFEKVEIETFEKSAHRFQVCGKVLDAKFPACIYCSEYLPTSSSRREVSIDAAVVELYQNKERVSFRTVPTDQLLSAGFDPEKLPKFDGKTVSLPRQICPGETERFIDKTTDISDTVVKFGATTGFTIGQLYVESVHVRIMNESMSFPNTNYCAVMCNQIEIQNMPQGEFFSLGDSGSFVFCINPDKTLSCIGMAIGLSARGTCLVTPIDSILQSFGLPSALKPYYPFGSGYTPSVSAQATSSISETDVKSMAITLNNIQDLVVSLNTSMQSVQKRLDSLDKKVQEIDDRNK
ncbi:uncharacterized protein LOC133203864 [Saccostrea echinata]|uniref:uncharacterized protein LOC133203864 n=1 Tax=Saccostrea echinata TaxID=191078 RepID=UPI002A80CB29|nr:uncharacterized protein LOC133203864 [Saccostrea echinata]